MSKIKIVDSSSPNKVVVQSSFNKIKIVDPAELYSVKLGQTPSTEIKIKDSSASPNKVITQSNTNKIKIVEQSNTYSVKLGQGPIGQIGPTGPTGPASQELISVYLNGDDNGSITLAAGQSRHHTIPYKCEVTEWTVTQAEYPLGSIEWNVNWCTYANWPSTTSVGGSGPFIEYVIPAYKNQETSPNWTKTTFDAGDIIQLEIDSVNNFSSCAVSLKIRKIT